MLGYTEGFTWRPRCKYVSNISKTSELRHRGYLKGCQRRRCEGCYQWLNPSPYEDEDFIYEGQKERIPYQACVEGKEGCPEGNECLDDHPFWEGDQGVNKFRRYACGARKTIDGRPNKKSEHYLSTWCNRPGEGLELSDVAQRVNADLDTNLPLRPNGQRPKEQCHQRIDRRSRSRPRETQRDDAVEDKWAYGEALEKKKEKAKKSLRQAKNELTETRNVTDELKATLVSMLGIQGLEEEEHVIKQLLESIPTLTKIAQLRCEIKQKQDENLLERHRNGEIVEIVKFGTEEEEGYRTGYEPGRSSTDIEPRIRVIRVLGGRGRG